MKQFKRVTALSLLLALVFGLVGGVPILTTSAASTVTDIDGNTVVNLMEGMNETFDALTIPGWSVMEGVAQCDDHLYSDGGSWALKLADSSSTNAVWSVSDPNPVQAGEKYNISAQVYGGIGQMTVSFYDADGKELTDKTITLATTKAANSWQTLSQDFTAAENAATLTVKVSTTAASTATTWFDAVVLRNTASDGFTLSFDRGSFNDASWKGTGTDVPSGWKFNKPTAALTKTDWDSDGDYEVAVDTTYTYNNGENTMANYWFYTTNFPVVAGFPYTATVDIYQTVAARGEMYIQFYEDEEAKVRVGSTAGIKFSGEGLTDGWQTLATNEIAPAGANYARIVFVGPAVGGTTYYDNVTFSFAEELYNTSYESAVKQQSGAPLGVLLTNQGSLGGVSSAEAHTGTQSVQTGKGPWWDTFRMIATPGDTFEATVWVKGDAEAAADADANCQILLYFYGADGKQIALKSQNFAPTAQWQQVKVTYDAPLDAYSVKAMVYMTRGNGKVYFDDIAIKRTTEKKLPRNTLNNGGFENVATAEGVNSTIAGLNISSSNQKSMIAVDYVGGDYGYTGRFFNAASMTAWTAAIPVTAGETYSATIDAKGEGRFQIWLRYYTSADAARTDYMKSSDGKDLGKYNSINLKSDTWQNVAASGSVAPEGAKYARIWLVGLFDGFHEEVDANFDNLTLFKGVAKIQIPGETGVLRNGDFEDLDETTGQFVDWPPFGSTNVLSVVDSTKEPDNVFAGRYALAITVPKDMAGSHGTFSAPFPVEGGTTYTLSAYVMEDFVDAAGFQMGVKYYDKYANLLATFYTTSPAIGEWNYLDHTGSAPDDAYYAQVFLVSGGGKGTVYFDNLEFKAVGSAEYAPVMFEKDDWDIVYDEYPRLDFDQEGLERIIKFSKSKSVCAYGYAGSVTLKSLLNQADNYLKETVMNVTYFNVKIAYPMYPVLEDPTCRVEFETAPEGFKVYPYMTQFGNNMVDRVQTLSLAYALTGEVKYGERAKQYALDICNFKYWVGYWQDIVNNSTGDETSQATGYMVDCVITAYDMCHDLFTDAELAKMETALIEKGLEGMYHDCWPRMSRDRDMDHATGMILAACVMLREDNIDQMKKYLDMGMTYINWRLNYFLKSGVNEGHMYDSLAIDDIIITLYTLERVTGYQGPWDHPYLEQLQIAFTGFFEMVNGTLPAYGDTQYRSTYYPYSAAVYSQKGNELATYYLAIGGGLSSNYDKLVWFTDMNIAELEIPDERVGNVNYMSAQGFGSLRTGWNIQDSILVIGAYDSHSSHNHLDQNSIQLAFNGTWILSDSEYKDMSGSALTYWQTKYTNSTIFVDGKPQVRTGLGSLQQMFNTHIYGYFIGSAPAAYGLEDKQAVLNKFDRHVIMLNHDSQPYYVVIDDLDSNKERNFGWNFYTNGWDRLEIDGEMVPEGGTASGNRIALSRFGSTLHSYFVGDAVSYKEVTYSGYGPTLLLESEKATNYQFMNIISLQKGSGSQISSQFEPLMTGDSTTITENSTPGEINWSTRRTDTTKNTLLSVSIGSRLVMFRAGETGDWVSFPFTVTKTQEYRVSLEVGQTMTYSGTWNLYIDDELITTFKPNGPMGIIEIDAGYMTLEEGEHRVKVMLSATPETAFGGTICSVGGITLDTGEGIGDGPLTILEEYNEGDLLGAKVGYGTVLNDIVVFNRGTGEISASGLVTNGQQASVIGLNGDDIAEGYAVTKGTSLKYGDQVLVTSESPVSIAMDYTMAKYPVKNDDTEDPVEVHEDFDIEVPVYYVSSKADAATKTSINVGIHAPYTAYIDGEEVESTHEGEMLTLTIPEGEHQITIVGTHQCVFDQYATNILNIKEWASCETGNVYYVSCECGKNGTETFVDGEPKGHTLTAVPAKEATQDENGNIAHWKCKKCGKLFADAEGTKELSTNAVVILSTNNTIWLIVGIAAGVLVLAGAGVVVFIILKKKKNKAGETPAEEVPAEETPAEETPAEEVPAEETPVEETPTEE